MPPGLIDEQGGTDGRVQRLDAGGHRYRDADVSCRDHVRRQPASFTAHEDDGRLLQVAGIRREAAKLTHETDTNYIFLSFVTKYLPTGLIGLILGVIFSAAMSASSGEVNSLATVTMVAM